MVEVQSPRLHSLFQVPDSVGSSVVFKDQRWLSVGCHPEKWAFKIQVRHVNAASFVRSLLMYGGVLS